MLTHYSGEVGYFNPAQIKFFNASPTSGGTVLHFDKGYAITVKENVDQVAVKLGSL